MTEEASLGVARPRQAIANQATCGSGEFELLIDRADRLCRKIDDELARLASLRAKALAERDAKGAGRG